MIDLIPAYHDQRPLLRELANGVRNYIAHFAADQSDEAGWEPAAELLR